MDHTAHLENQRVVASAFFRNLMAEDASGIDLALAHDLLEALANGGAPPEVIQYSCAFEGSERAAGRFVFGWLPEQLTVGGGAVDAPAVYRSLVSLCEFGAPAGIEALTDQLGAPSVRCVWVGFDARVEPERTRTRFALTLAPGEGARKLVEGLLAEVGAPPDAARAIDVVTEVALEHGAAPPADVRLAWPVAPATVAGNAAIAGDPAASAMADGAVQARLVRGVGAAGKARIVFLYGAGDAADGQLAALARRSALAADFRHALRQANRAIPAGAGMTFEPWGATLAVENGRPLTDHVAVLLRTRVLGAP